MTAGPEEIAIAVRRLTDGGLVAFPTETVYGLGADALRERAVLRVFDLKGRPPANPLIVHVVDVSMARELAEDWPPEAERLARAFWPGPLSIIVRRNQRVPSVVTAGGPTVALRCPDHPLTLALIDSFGGPIVGPSANPSGAVSPTTAEHVRSVWAESEVYVLDGGPCRGGIESTVVSLADEPRVLRPGLIDASELSRVLGRNVEAHRHEDVAQGEAAPSPGLLGPHYRPRTPARLFDASEWPGVLPKSGRAIVLMLRERSVPTPHEMIRMPADARAYAARLYAALREADAEAPSVILIERIPSDSGSDAGVWGAIAERLARAAGG